MGRAGRKRKSGTKREPNGRASRIDMPRFDTGSERAAARFKKYGTNGVDAIGRAYVHGLLGQDADLMMDTARKVARVFWSAYGLNPKTCTLDDGMRAGNDNSDETPEERLARIKENENWLNRCTDIVDAMDRARRYRAAFNNLVIDLNEDSGPRWLDAIIWAKGHGREPLASDLAALERAKAALVKVMG